MEQSSSLHSLSEDDHLLRLCLYIAIAPPLVRFSLVHCTIFGELIDKGWLATLAPTVPFLGAASLALGVLSHSLVLRRNETRVLRPLICATILAASGWSTAVFLLEGLPNRWGLEREHQISVVLFLLLTCLLAGVVLRMWRIRTDKGRRPQALILPTALVSCGWLVGWLVLSLSGWGYRDTVTVLGELGLWLWDFSHMLLFGPGLFAIGWMIPREFASTVTQWRIVRNLPPEKGMRLNVTNGWVIYAISQGGILGVALGTTGIFCLTSWSVWILLEDFAIGLPGLVSCFTFLFLGTAARLRTLVLRTGAKT